MCWSKARTRKQEKMLSCILKNQMLIMQTMQTGLVTYEHTSRYGSYYRDKLIKGVNNTADILQIPRKKNREDCPHRMWDITCLSKCALCETVDDNECLLD